MKKKAFKDWSGLALLVVWIIFHYRILFSDHTFVYLDAGNFFYPLWKWGADIFKTGLLPLWNPDAALGFPYAADPENLLLYPPKIFLYDFLTAGAAFKVLILGQSLWLLTGFWFFARGLVYSQWAILVSALAFGFGFEAVALETGSPALFITFSWVPWAFLAADRLWKAKRGGVLFFSFCLAMQLDSGYPIYAYLTLFSILLWKGAQTFLSFGENKKRLGRQIFSLGIGVVVAGLYNLVWIIPFCEFIPRSNIARRLDLSSGLGVKNLGTWLNPFFCGHPLMGWHETPFFFWSYFMGLPAAVLIFFSLIREKIDRALVWGFSLSLLLSLGEALKVAPWLKSFVPGYSWVARSGYWLPLVSFFAALLTAQGVQSLLEKRREARDSWFWFLISIGFIFLALALGVPFDLFSFWVGCFFLLLAGWERLSLNARGFCVVLALVFSLFPVVESFNFTLPQNFYDLKPPLAGVVPKGGRIFHTPDFFDREKAVSGESVSAIYGKFKEVLLPNWPLQYGLEQTGINNTIWLIEFLRWYYAPQEAPILARMKFIRYLNTVMIVGKGTFAGTVALRGAAPAPVWIHVHPLEKWFSVSNALPEKDWGSDFKAMENPGFDFAKTCYVHDANAAGSYEVRNVTESKASVNQVRLDAPGGRRKALLISSELAYPGWRASVEGKSRPLEVVNHSFRGIVLKPGEHHVVLNYRPTSFRLGMFFSLLSIGVWSFLLLKFFSPEDERHGRARI